MSQRNFVWDDVLFVLRYGTRMYQRGAVAVALRKKDVPSDIALCDRFARLQGTVVILGQDHPVVITVYRNAKKGFKHLRCKKRYSGFSRHNRHH